MFKFAWPCRVGLFVLILFMMTVPGMAQRAVGVQAGVSANPDQFYFGGNMMVGKVAENFWFRPSAEIGFGDNATLFGLNGEFVYLIPIQKKGAWSAYFGGGPALVIATDHGNESHDNNTNVGPGFNFLAGARKPYGVFAEIKVGLMDSPEFKFGVGYTFR